jgi:C1A family cysteine protease
MKREYNLKKQEQDERDYKLSAVIDVHPNVKIPSKVDIRTKCPPVFDQGSLGSCTANAGVAARLMLDNLNANLSRLDLYYNERLIENTINEDSGANMRDIGNAISKYGICEETYFPYDVTKFTNKPTDVANTNGLKYKIKSYYSVKTTDDIKNVLAVKQQPVLIGMAVYSSFESDAVAKTGIVPLPKKKEQILGGHAVLVVGYDNVKKWFIVRNSWGSSWGDKGYFYLPYTYFTKGYAYDFWVLQN